MSHGGKIIVESLVAHGVRRVSCVAGESYLPVLDAFLDFPQIEVVTCRQESGVSFMAAGWAALENAPAVAFVTRAPGACNAAVGLHEAMQSSTPLVLFVGLIAKADRGREAFQEFDMVQMFGSLSKWAAVIDDARDIPAIVARAFHEAVSGRPGPVVIGLPEDVLFPEVDGAGQASPIAVESISPKDKDIAALREALQKAERPIMLVGGSLWRDEDCHALEGIADRAELPVVASFRRQDIFNHRHRCYAGELVFGANPKLVERIRQADLVLILNARVTDPTTQGYTLLQGDKGQKIIHVYPSKSVFGKGCKVDIGVESHISPVLKALAGMEIDGSRWADWRSEARKDYEQWNHIEPGRGQKWNGADVTQVFAVLRDLLPDDVILTGDAGNFSGWVQRYLRYGRPGRLLAPGSGSMGYAVPAAIGASIARPDRLVVGFCGDGGFMMTGQELATAAHHGAKPVIIVFNNGTYGTIRMHQEREYPGRHSATDLTNPDFVRLAQSYGAFAARVENVRNFKSVWKKALESNKVALIEIVMDPRQSTAMSKL